MFVHDRGPYVGNLGSLGQTVTSGFSSPKFLALRGPADVARNLTKRLSLLR